MLTSIAYLMSTYLGLYLWICIVSPLFSEKLLLTSGFVGIVFANIILFWFLLPVV